MSNRQTDRLNLTMVALFIWYYMVLNGTVLNPDIRMGQRDNTMDCYSSLLDEGCIGTGILLVMHIKHWLHWPQARVDSSIESTIHTKANITEDDEGSGRLEDCPHPPSNRPFSLPSSVNTLLHTGDGCSRYMIQY